MKRREILRYTAYVTGIGISAPLASTILSGCKMEAPSSDTEGWSFFSASDMQLLQEVIDIIIPRTDSPSASDVGVHRTIDHMVGNVYKEDDLNAYSESISSLFTHLKESSDIASAIAAMESQADRTSDTMQAYDQLKQQAIAYYLSSEEVGTKYLNYLPVPGEYQGCISLEEAGGKKWAI